MLPPVTNWPANRLTPSIWGLESRPFLELPTPFLCAMPVSDLDGGDANAGDRLAMPAMPAVVLAPLELHDLDLLAAALGHDLARHLRRAQPVHRGDHLVVAGDEDHRREGHGLAGGPGQLLHRDHLPGRHPILLATGRNDRLIHDVSPFGVVVKVDQTTGLSPESIMGGGPAGPRPVMPSADTPRGACAGRAATGGCATSPPAS